MRVTYATSALKERYEHLVNIAAYGLNTSNVRLRITKARGDRWTWAVSEAKGSFMDASVSTMDRPGSNLVRGFKTLGLKYPELRDSPAESEEETFVSYAAAVLQFKRQLTKLNSGRPRRWSTPQAYSHGIRVLNRYRKSIGKEPYLPVKLTKRGCLDKAALRSSSKIIKCLTTSRSATTAVPCSN